MTNLIEKHQTQKQARKAIEYLKFYANQNYDCNRHPSLRVYGDAEQYMGVFGKCLDYRLSILAGGYILQPVQLIVEEMERQGKERYARRIEEQLNDFKQCVKEYDKNLDPNDPWLLPALGEKQRALKLAQLLEGALPSLDLASTKQNGNSDATPKTDASLIYQADASTFYNIPKSVLSKAAQKQHGEPGYLWSGRAGKRVFYKKADIEKINRSRTKLKS